MVLHLCLALLVLKATAGLHANHGGGAAEEVSPIKPPLEDLEPKMLVLSLCFALVFCRSFFFLYLSVLF